MRFWIYWNDLVQGPFEVQELAALRAFATDLPVCEEGREEWGPAAAVPELLPYFDVAEPRYAAATAPPPPPPPEPPRIVPLQGEFFSEPLGQQSFLDQNGSKHFSFRPVQDEPTASSGILPFLPLTSPFRFAFRGAAAAAQLAPGLLAPLPELPPVPALDPESPETELGILEPEEVIVLEPREADLRTFPLKPAIAEPPPPTPPQAIAPPVIELPATQPVPMKPAVMPPIQPKPTAPLVSREPAAQAKSEATPQIPIKPAIQKPVTPPSQPKPVSAPVAIPAREQPRQPVLDLPDDIEPMRLWPWLALAGVVLTVAGGFVFHSRSTKVTALQTAVAVAPQEPAMPVSVAPPAEPPADVTAEPPPPPRPALKHRVKKAVPKPVKVMPPQPEKQVVIPEVIEKPTVVEQPVEAPTEKPAALPGLNAPPSPAESPVLTGRGREQDAIDLVLTQKIYDGKRSIGENAKIIIDTLHERELLYAADTGTRLYQPDKITWSALHEQGGYYRVYLNFLAWQGNGERVMTRSDQFSVDVEKKIVKPLDDNTRHDFYDLSAIFTKQTNPKAVDIQTMLDGVDALNRHKLRAVILKSQKKKEDRKKMQVELQAAEDKLQRQVVYFRTKYAEKTLQNLAKAFDFAAALKGK